MCGFILGFIFLLMFVASAGGWLEQNPEGWIVVFLAIAVFVAIWYFLRKSRIENNIAAMERIADELEAIIKDFAGIDGQLTLRKGEKAIYQRGEVQLREYKETGSDFQSGNAGVIVRATENVGVTLGGSRGSLTPKPEAQAVIDIGTAIFTNQRILFAGPNHAREWELDKLITFSAGDNGFTLDLAVSNRSRVSTLAADSSTGITPGIMAAVCIELFQDGEESARKSAQELIADIRKKVTEHRAK